MALSRRVIWWGRVSWAMICLLGAAGSAAGGSGGVEPVFTNSARFHIPFQYDAGAMQELGARGIRLYVSRNGGGDWTEAQRVSPDAGRFDFEAPQDGEYWFAVRTVDREGQLHPEGEEFRAGLKVVVDTAAPSLQIEVSPAEAGRVGLTWTAEDPHLKPETLELEYRQPGQSRWLPVHVSAGASGETAWSVPEGGIVAVRGSIEDRASNTGRNEDQAWIPPADSEGSEPPGPDFREPIAAASSGPETGPLFPEDSSDAAGGGQAGAPRRIINSRRFQIGYTLEGIGPSGIQSVVLYMSRDGGRTWEKYGEDGDQSSPFEVTVPEEGEYGFRLRIRSGTGWGSAPPRGGDKPAIVVIVDETAPEAKLLPVEYRRRPDGQRIILRWEADDEHLIDRPVALSYSVTPDGPWEPISGWQSNRGRYEWTVPPGVPSEAYLRLTVRDAAGNTRRVRSGEPMTVDVSRPSANIVDVKSVGSGSRRR